MTIFKGMWKCAFTGHQQIENVAEREKIINDTLAERDIVWHVFFLHPATRNVPWVAEFGIPLRTLRLNFIQKIRTV